MNVSEDQVTPMESSENEKENKSGTFSGTEKISVGHLQYVTKPPEIG